ncbi:MAG: serine protease [Bacteroidetes bacterium]|nr:serine protease [Bacteroidota bacterium]
MSKLFSLYILLNIFYCASAQSSLWTFESLQQYWLANGTDANEGIYENAQAESGSPKYTVALKSNGSNSYQLIYLSGAAQEDASRWTVGDTKANLTGGNTANTYKAKWYMGDKSSSKDLSIVIEAGVMHVNWNTRPAVIYNRIFPDKQIIIQQKNVAAIVPEPIYNPTLVNAFLVSAKGILLTQNNMLDASDNVIVKNATTGEKYSASIINRNIENNLALLQVNDPTFIFQDTLPYNFGTALSIGDNIFCLGYNTADTSTSKNKHLQNAVIISSSNNRYGVSPKINPWCNGSPVFDRQGNLAGMVSTDLANGSSTVIPVNSIRKIINDNNIALAQKVLSDVNMKPQEIQMELLLPVIFIIDPAEVR